MDRIEEIRAREQAATHGEWERRDKSDYAEIHNSDSWGKALFPIALVGHGDDADFIAHARADIPYLLSEIEKAWVQLHVEIEKEKALKAENARLSKERDAAIVDMTVMANAIRESELLDTVMHEGCCFACKHEYNEECPGYNSDVCFEWRGIEPAESEESITQSMPEDMRDRFRESYSGQPL